jgi:hypothetical protein
LRSSSSSPILSSSAIGVFSISVGLVTLIGTTPRPTLSISRFYTLPWT